MVACDSTPGTTNEGEENWMTLIVVYLKDGRLPEDKNEARKLRIKAAMSS